ncbi:hypothetical protein PGTUg99_017700 [Puccinia graminis f. sp. tritici]|uniref:3'-5' exonuclease domain-containing protein n=1 Tax=Puccinia graminis f. sp. tritici TaxID=56615 RepID=A0A5B0R6B1_PUCGR|nr:hypothetical protein PGTUg99_017700 [Puccinia graminis f. sp. tritici]
MSLILSLLVLLRPPASSISSSWSSQSAVLNDNSLHQVFIKLPSLILRHLSQHALVSLTPQPAAGYYKPANLPGLSHPHPFRHPACLLSYHLKACPLLLTNWVPHLINSKSLSLTCLSFLFPKPTNTTALVHMEIKFIPNDASPAAHPSTSLRKTSSLRDFSRRRAASVDSSDPSDPSSPKSSRFSCAGSGTTAGDIHTRQSSSNEHPLRNELPASSRSDGSKPQKTSYIWRKTLYEYFKADDEPILTPDDEWWLGSNKPYTEKQEPPSGKTRSPKQNVQERSAAEDAATDSPETIASPEAEESPNNECRSALSVELPITQAPSASPTPDSPVKTSPASATFTASDFPDLSSGPVTVREYLSFQLPDGPWKNKNQHSSASGLPPLKSPSRPPPSYPATRFICSISSTTTRTLNHPARSTAAANEKEPKRSEAERREETLKATLPPFKLADPAFSPQKITQCPSEQHPISELPQLIKSLCNDGISLPSGRSELEGGPYVAVAFDMEWTISRVRGHENRTAVIQLGSRSQVLIVQISSDVAWRAQGIMPSCLIDFLVNPQIVKIGVGIRNDGLKLIRDHKLGQKPFLNSFLELSRLVRALGQPDCASGYSRLISLQQIVADHLKVYLPKIDTRTSDWAKPLTATQIDYAASDVIATVRVTMHLFKLFEGRIRKADSGLMILQYIESLEPTFERSAPPAQPPMPVKPKDPEQTSTTEAYSLIKPKGLVPPKTKESVILAKSKLPALPQPKWPGPAPPTKRNHWRVLVPASGPQSVEAKKQWVVQAPTFLGPSVTNLKTKVPPGAQKAWELWYHEGLAINQCVKLIKMSPITFAINLGKMLIHLKLNKLSLDDYYQDRIKARLANPQAFEDLHASLNIPDDIGDEKAEGDCAAEASSGTADGQVALAGSSTCCDGEIRAQEQTEGKDDQVVLPVSEIQPLSSSDDKSAGDVPVIVKSPDQTATSKPVAEELSATSVSDVAAKSRLEGNNEEPVQQVTSWYEETESSLKGDQTSLTVPESEPTSQEIRDQSPTIDADQDGQKAENHDLVVMAGTTTEKEEKKKIGQTKSKNFKIDDAQFLRDKSGHTEPLFSLDEAARIREFNRRKAELIDSFVVGFAVHKRLRTSRNYFQFP